MKKIATLLIAAVLCFGVAGCEKAEQKFQKDSMITKIAFGLLAIVIIVMSISISFWATELYTIKWKVINN